MLNPRVTSRQLPTVDAIDQVVMNTRLHYLGSAARTIEPRLNLAVLTCMDARVDVYGLLGLRPGDAHVIRNAGGRAAQDAVQAGGLPPALLSTPQGIVVHPPQVAVCRLFPTHLP